MDAVAMIRLARVVGEVPTVGILPASFDLCTNARR